MDKQLLFQASGLKRLAGQRLLLEDISVAIQGGDRIAVVGPTGSGKTLLLRALAMLDPTDTGEINWKGMPVRGNEIPRFRSRVIYLHQRPVLTEGTVEANLRQAFSLHTHRHKQYNHSRIVAMLELLGRDESFLAKLQRELSGGEAQLTALMRAIQLDPDILLLDEPTAALDVEATKSVETLVAHWLEELPDARAVVWVTHDREQARRVCTSVLNIRDGRLA